MPADTAPAPASAKPRGNIVGVFETERAAQVAIATHWPGPEDYVTVVRGGAFTWAVYVEHDDMPEVSR